MTFKTILHRDIGQLWMDTLSDQNSINVKGHCYSKIQKLLIIPYSFVYGGI